MTQTPCRCTGLATATLLLLFSSSAPAQDTLSPVLHERMTGARPGERLTVYLVMRDQLQVEDLAPRTRGFSKKTRRSTVAATLRAHARSSQFAVRAVLDRAVADGTASDILDLWIGNAVAFRAEPGVIQALAELPGVDRIREVRPVPFEALTDGGPGSGATVVPPAAESQFTPTSNIMQLQAPQLWNTGITGAGILIGHIDGGFDYTHPDLASHVWNNPGEIPGNGIDDDLNGFIDDVMGWDFTENDNDPFPLEEHGTRTAGLLVGDGTNGMTTGVAVGAMLVPTRVIDEPTYWAAQQYCLQAGVDVICSSLSFKWPFDPDYHMHRQVCDMELAAGIIHANSIGNQGLDQAAFPVPFNIGVPGSCPAPWRHPDEVLGGRSSVMGCGGIHLADDSLYESSSRGPAAWEDLILYDPGYAYPQDPAYWDYPYGGFGGGQPGLIKPDVATFTDTVPTTLPGGIYGDFGGTSASTPQLGGTMALLLQLQPQAEPRHIAAAIQLSATDLDAPGKDSNTGTGKLLAFDAARRLVLLGKTDDQTPAVGGPFTLSLFGEPGASVLTYLGFDLSSHPSGFNLDPPFFKLFLLTLDAAGQLTLPLGMPNDPGIAGTTLYFQFFAFPVDLPRWGPGVLASVPEDLTITN